MRQAICVGCRKVTLVNHYTRQLKRNGKMVANPGEYCADCFQRLGLEDLRRKTGRSGRKEDGASPYQENAIRAMEDR